MRLADLSMDIEYIAHYIGRDRRPQSVREHLGEVASLSSVFADKIRLPSFGKLAGFLHDFGKYGKQFQDYIRSAEGQIDPNTNNIPINELKGKVDHSSAGAQLVWETMENSDAIARLCAQVLVLCVASHHSGLIDCLAPDGKDKFNKRMAKNKEETHLDEVREVADKDIRIEITNLLQSPELINEVKEQLKRLFAEEPSLQIREFYCGILVRFLFSALIDADRLSAAGRSAEMGSRKAGIPIWDDLIEKFERYINSIKPKNKVDEIRSEVSMACREFAFREKGLYRLTVPTGGGKTLSSLRFGLHHAAHHKMEHIIYVIPYTSIIDQNAEVARTVLEEANGENTLLILEHHSNLTPEKETWQNQLLSENWDAPIIFTTMVQFLETLFVGGTRGVRRMHQLANSVIIFDEIQTLPIKTVHLFNNAVNFLVKGCGSTIVFCTATQPLLDRVDKEKGAAILSAESEIAPHPHELFKALRRVNVIDARKTGGWTEDEIAKLAVNEAKETGSVLIVVNTKASAQRLYELCRQHTDAVYHLSTNMCPAHRMKVIKKLKKRLNPMNSESSPLICVSTQLIEAGVDLDFGSVIRYMAGLDSIGQAAGRCNRNGSCPYGNVFIVNPAQESLGRLPEIENARKDAERVLREFGQAPNAFDNDLLSPRTMGLYYKYYFFNRASEMVYPIKSISIGHDDNLLSLLSGNQLAVAAYHRSNKSMPALSLKQSFKSAGDVFEVIDTPADGVIVPYSEEGRSIITKLCASGDPEEIRKLLRKSQRYSVNMYSNMFAKLANSGFIHETQKESGIYYLDELHYSMDTGVVFDKTELMDFLNV